MDDNCHFGLASFSRAVVTIQEQAKEIERLRNELSELRKATGQVWIEVSEGLPPDDGRWYWVHGAAFSGPVPAKRGFYDAGGWSNEDTWQDWSHDVERYCLIHKPPAIEGGE